MSKPKINPSGEPRSSQDRSGKSDRPIDLLQAIPNPRHDPSGFPNLREGGGEADHCKEADLILDHPKPKLGFYCSFESKHLVEVKGTRIRPHSVLGFYGRR